MLDFVIFAATAVLGLSLILLFFYCGGGGNGHQTSGAGQTTAEIPRWRAPPADSEKGDLEVMMTTYGSLHEYLVHLHDNGESPVSSFWWGKTHVVSVCSPEAFKQTTLLVNRPGEIFRAFEPLITPFSIQYANDEEWTQRSKCTYPTLKGVDLKSYFPHFVQIAQEAETRWSGHAPNEPVNLVEEVFPMTIKGIARSCLGDVFESEEELKRLADAYHICWRTMEEGMPAQGSEKEKQFFKHREVIMDIIRRILKDRREGEGLQYLPFIDSMLQNYDSEEKIEADALSFMIGGFHTSGYMLTWMLWYLAVNTESQERLREEVARETGEERGERLMNFTLRNDTFLRRVQDETIRLSTLGPFAARYNDQDMTVCGYSIPASTPIIHALGVALKNQTSWKNVQDWDPDRFSPDGRRGNEFCPFGVNSRRKCPGYLFSYFEVGVFVSVLLSKFVIVPVEGQTVVQVHGLVTEPKEDIRVYLRPRESA